MAIAARDELVDPHRLAGWLRAHAPQLAGPFSLRRIGAGQSCLTYLLEGEEWSAVLRRPPRGELPAGAFDVLREYRIMRALRSGGARVPVPETYGACDDPGVIGAPFCVMEHVRGAVVRDTLPAGTTDARLRELGRSMIETLAAIHETPVAEVGLGELGRPEGFLERQLRRMQMQWERIRARKVPELDELGRWLADHLPSHGASSLVHGDYKLDNLIVGLPASGEVCAVIDWELSTRADPLIDLGWWLYFWLDPGEEPFAIPVASITDAPALPRRAELIERYAATTGRAVDGISWYVGFGGWKITIIMETSYQRFLAGIADHPTFAALDEGVPMMAQRALALARERA